MKTLEEICVEFEDHPAKAKRSLTSYASAIVNAIKDLGDVSPLINHLNGSLMLSHDKYPNTTDVCDKDAVVNTPIVMSTAVNFLQLAPVNTSQATESVLESDDPFFNLWSIASFVLAYKNDLAA